MCKLLYVRYVSRPFWLWCAHGWAHSVHGAVYAKYTGRAWRLFRVNWFTELLTTLRVHGARAGKRLRVVIQFICGWEAKLPVRITWKDVSTLMFTDMCGHTHVYLSDDASGDVHRLLICMDGQAEPIITGPELWWRTPSACANFPLAPRRARGFYLMRAYRFDMLSKTRASFYASTHPLGYVPACSECAIGSVDYADAPRPCAFCGQETTMLAARHEGDVETVKL